MNAHDALVAMIGESGSSYFSIERTMGVKQNYLKRLRYGGSTPRTDVAARIADACGYDLILRRRDDGSETTIAP